MIRESEVLVYAIGIDGQAESSTFGVPPTPRRRRRRLAHPVSRGRRPRGPGGVTSAPADPVALPAGTSADGRAGHRGDDRVNAARFGKLPTTAAAARKSFERPRPRSGDREHRRRTEPAVLPRLRVDDEERRPLARDPGGSARQIAPRQRPARLHRDAVAAAEAGMLTAAIIPPCVRSRGPLG